MLMCSSILAYPKIPLFIFFYCAGLTTMKSLLLKHLPINQTNKSKKKKVNKSNINRLAEEHERRSGRIPATTESPKSLIIINTEQRERELDLIPSPHPPDPVRVTSKPQSAQSTQHGPHAHHVQPLVATESHDDGADARGGRRGNVAEAQMLPERVVAGNGAPETADAGRNTERAAVESFQDFQKNVYVVIDAELGSLLFNIVFH